MNTPLPLASFGMALGFIFAGFSCSGFGLGEGFLEGRHLQRRVDIQDGRRSGRWWGLDGGEVFNFAFNLVRGGMDGGWMAFNC